MSDRNVVQVMVRIPTEDGKSLLQRIGHLIREGLDPIDAALSAAGVDPRDAQTERQRIRDLEARIESLTAERDQARADLAEARADAKAADLAADRLRAEAEAGRSAIARADALAEQIVQLRDDLESERTERRGYANRAAKEGARAERMRGSLRAINATIRNYRAWRAGSWLGRLAGAPSIDRIQTADDPELPLKSPNDADHKPGSSE